MKKIKLSNNNKYAIVDDEDYPYINRFKWYVERDSVVKVFVYSGNRMVGITMEKFLFKHDGNFIVLHSNGNPLDFRKNNLSINTNRGEKIHHSKKASGKSSIYKGVRKSNRKSGIIWGAAITKNGTRYWLGWSKNEKDAAKKYNEKSKELYGKNAYQNVIN